MLGQGERGKKDREKKRDAREGRERKERKRESERWGDEGNECWQEERKLSEKFGRQAGEGGS